MENNIILLIIGIITLIVPIIILLMLKNKECYDKTTYNKENKFASKAESDIILQRIKKLEQEVIQLRQENKALVQESKNKNHILDNDIRKDDNFKPILNYSIFKEKNSSIIELYKKGNSKEQIAKSLNKSIREIEMVIKLIK